MDLKQIACIVVFVICMLAIMTGKLHRALVSLVGALVLIALQILSFNAAIAYLDFNTLGVLFGMMLFVAIVKLSGIFEFLALRCAQIAGGRPWKIMVMFVLLTAVLSAFLDNVTTVLLVGPMSLAVCKLMGLDPLPFLVAQIFASNIGGTATLIGDPPNIMIGSAADLNFVDFILNNTLPVILSLAAIIGVFYVRYAKSFPSSKARQTTIMKLDANSHIKDKRLVKQSYLMILFIIIGFLIHGALDIESSVVALGAACIMLVISKQSIEAALAQVEWTTLVFFAGLFVIVGGLSETGVIDLLAHGLINATGGNAFTTMLVLLFGSAIISSFLDNIPFVATLIPLLLAMQSEGMDVWPLWWALSLGACLGGNGTLVGASANVVLADISKKNGYEITFMQFLKIGLPIMLITVVIAGVYLVVRFPPT